MAEREQIHQLVKALLETSRIHRATLENGLSDMGCSPSQHRMLYYIQQSGGTVSQKELAEKLKISGAAVASTSKKLEEKGYVERKSLDRDSRYNLICITDKGIENMKQSKSVFDTVDDRMLEGLTDSEIFTVTEAMKKMWENLKKDNSLGCVEEERKEK